MPADFRRKGNRLPLDEYRGARAYFLTLKCAKGVRAFASATVVESCIDTLRSFAAISGFEVLAYCFMPDHAHLLVEGNTLSNLIDFVHGFKQRTGHAYRRPTGVSLWQKSYYDRILRRDEDVREVARYIVGNPVRARLAAEARDYPHSGSFTWGAAIMEA
jgi:putative transposase